MIHSVFRGKHISVFAPPTLNPAPRTPNACRGRLLAVVATAGFLLPASVDAQMLGGGWILELYGMVQVEPGQNVVTLEVKKEHIRFVVHNVRSSDQNFAPGRFYSETTNRVPGMYMKGPD